MAEQTFAPVEHLIGFDYERVGPSTVRNRLAGAASGDWLAFLDDDDVFYPQHLATLVANAGDTDLVWSLCDVDGQAPIHHRCNVNKLLYGNFIPVTVLLRKAAFDAVCGFPLVPIPGGEDVMLWRRLLERGFRFKCVHETTWCYRRA